MKKIVILALHLGTGGAERMIASLANLLCEKNNVTIISTYRLNEKPAFNLDSKIKIEYLLNNLKPNKEELKRVIKQHKILPILKQGRISLKVLHLRKKLMVKAIKEIEADIIISTRTFHNKLLGKYGKKGSIKIAQEHNHHNNNSKYIKKVIKSLKNIDYFMPVSKELCEFYSDKIKTTKVVYIPNFIERIPTKKSNFQNKQLISVGRLDKVKAFEDLIDIFNLFQNNYSDWNLHIVGEGEERENLQKKIKELKLENKVFLCGNKNQEELEGEYLNSSMFLMTSFSESFGLVLVEAASYGLPLIAFDSARGAKEIIENNKNGFLIAERNNENFVDKICELIENSEKKAKFSNDSLEISKKFTKEKVAKMWNEFLNCLD